MRWVLNLINIVIYSAIVLILVVSTPDIFALSTDGRYFRVVDYGNRELRLDNNMLKMVEIDRFGRDITGDVVDVWFQHYDPGGYIRPQARVADIAVFCFPDAMTDYDRKSINHVLEEETGLVYAIKMFDFIGIYSQNSPEMSLSYKVERFIKQPIEDLIGVRRF